MLENERNSGYIYHTYSVLLVSHSKETNAQLAKNLQANFEFHATVTVSSYAQALAESQQHHHDIIIIEAACFQNKLAARAQIHAWQSQHSQVVLVVNENNLRTIITDWQLAPIALIINPLDLEQVGHALEQSVQALRQSHMLSALVRDFSRHHSSDIIGESDATITLKRTIHQRCHETTPLLIEGEPGTGKELVARQLHLLGERHGPFVPLSAHISIDDALEKILYGQVIDIEKEREYVLGLFNQANGGTLYIDEIENLPIQVQQTLVNVFETGKIRPLGAAHDIPVNVRVITATNRPLVNPESVVNTPSPLLSRLYHDRISVVPLRQRKSDLKTLLPFLAKRLCGDLCLPLPTWTEDDIAMIRDYPWPGNVRELKNVVENCILLKQSPTDYWQRTHHLSRKNPVSVTVSHGISMPTLRDDPSLELYYQSQGYPSTWTLKQIERHHIEKVVIDHEGNRSAAARTLGVNRKTLERKFKDWENEL